MKNVPGPRKTSLKKFGDDLREFLRTEPIASILEHGDWGAGGCWVLAETLVEFLGKPAELVAVSERRTLEEGEELLIPVSHVAVRYGDWYIDHNGVQTEDELLENLQDEGYEFPEIQEWSEDRAADARRGTIPCDPRYRKELLRHLKKSFSGVQFEVEPLPAEGVASHVEIRRARGLDPMDIQIFLRDGDEQIGRAHAVYGTPKKLVPWLRSVYAYGMADRIEEEEARRRVGLLEYVEVMPRHRGGGYGRRLVLEAVELLKKQGAQVVYLQASSDVGGIPESILVAFYESAGFVESGRTGDAGDDPVMILDLEGEASP